MAVPTLSNLWRTSPRDDRELIRSYAGWPVSEYNLQILTTILNRAADVSPGTVTRCQAWIDEIETLEQDWSDQVGAGTAHLGNAEQYEGPIPGTTVSRDDQLKKADVLEWDTSLLRVKTTAGRRSEATASGVLGARIAQLQQRVLQALGIKPYGEGSGGTQLLRS
jgi:hypothetical protein